MIHDGSALRRFVIGVAVAILAFATTELRAQTPPGSPDASNTNWTRFVSASPTTLEMLGRVEHAMAFDPARGRTVLFGGVPPPVGAFGSNETWEWDDVTGWVELAPVQRPPARRFASMSYDETRGRVLLFGGTSTALGPGRSDTWTWDGTNWQELSPPSRPPAMVWSALACDSARGTCILFGGTPSSYPDSGNVGGTWEWDGMTWIERVLTMSPPSRFFHAMAYDRSRGKIVLFGGYHLNDTWEWDGSSWTERSPANKPPPRGGHVMAYHEALGRVFLFSGCENIGYVANHYFCDQPLADMWSWDGVDWTQVFPATNPAPRFKPAISYDSTRKRLVMFGGASSATSATDPSTWTYGGEAESDGGAEDAAPPAEDGDTSDDAHAPNPPGSGPTDGNSSCSCTHVAVGRGAPKGSAIFLLLLIFARRSSRRPCRFNGERDSTAPTG